MFLLSECASFLLPSTRSHCAFLRWHKQPSARMLPQRRSKGMTAVCPSEMWATCLLSVGLDSHAAQHYHHPMEDTPNFPWPQDPQSLTDTPCHHSRVELPQAWLSDVPLRLCLAAASQGDHSNPCPFAISKKCLNTQVQGGHYTLCLRRWGPVLRALGPFQGSLRF